MAFDDEDYPRRLIEECRTAAVDMAVDQDTPIV
jgi:hypothetical protein